MIKTITYAGKTYEVQDDNRLSEEYILVGPDQRILTLDALKAFGIPIEYDRPPFEELEGDDWLEITIYNVDYNSLAHFYRG